MEKKLRLFLIRWKLSFDLEYDENTKSDLVTFTDTLPKRSSLLVKSGKVKAFDTNNQWDVDVESRIAYKDNTGWWRNFNTNKKSEDECAILIVQEIDF